MRRNAADDPRVPSALGEKTCYTLRGDSPSGRVHQQSLVVQSEHRSACQIHVDSTYRTTVRQERKTLARSFAVNYETRLIMIPICKTECHEFADTHAGGEQNFERRKIAKTKESGIVRRLYLGNRRPSESPHFF